MFTANVSRSGMQLACAVTLATVIQRDLDSGRLDLELELPGQGPCHLAAAVRYLAEVDDEVLVGLEITAFEGGDAEARYHAFCEQAATRYRAL